MRADCAPDATDFISGLYAFNRFHSTDLKGNAEVKNLAALRAEQAAKRDVRLKEIQRPIGTEPRITKATTATASLAQSDDTDGPAHLRSSYAAQIPNMNRPSA